MTTPAPCRAYKCACAAYEPVRKIGFYDCCVACTHTVQNHYIPDSTKKNPRGKR